MNVHFAEWGSSIPALAAAGSALLQSPFAFLIALLPALTSALVNRRFVVRLALLLDLVVVLAAAWLLSVDPGSQNTLLLAVAMLAALCLVQQSRTIELSRIRRELEAVRAEVAELHAGMERDLLASIRSHEPSTSPLREVMVEKVTREPDLRPVRGSAT